jgi:hypothetical protein
MAASGRFYSDPMFGTVYRQWFGLTNRNGGSGAFLTGVPGHPIQFNETQFNVVKRWYPPRKGAIQMMKQGVVTIATLGKGEQSFRLSVSATTAAAAFATLVASTTSAPWTIASKVTSKGLTAGSYVSIMASTNVCSTGSVAIFIDWRPKYVSGATSYDITDTA